MKIVDLLVFLGELHSMKSAAARQTALHWLKRVELFEYADKKVQELSKGMQQKIQFIGTILHNPELIILDEPFSGLDPVNVNLIKDVLLEFKEQGKAIIFSTHQMETAEKLCDEILMINQGKKVLDGPLTEIQNQYGSNSIHLEYEGNHHTFENEQLIQTVDDFGNYAEIKLRDGVSPQDLLRYLIDKIKISRFETRKSSLNEIFIQQVEGGAENE
jgi:ABC-2 type transport system ATP-binding protein